CRSLKDVEAFVIKAFDFDGEGKIKTLVGLLCNCRKVVLDDVKFRGYLETGLRFTNCSSTRKQSAEVNKRAEVSRAEFTPLAADKPPMIFEVFKEFPENPRNDHIVVNDDCKFGDATTVFSIIDLQNGENKDLKL